METVEDVPQPAWSYEISGGKVVLVARVLQYARGDHSCIPRESQENVNEEMSSSANSSESQSSDSEVESNGFVEHCFEVMFVPDTDVQQINM